MVPQSSSPESTGPLSNTKAQAVNHTVLSSGGPSNIPAIITSRQAHPPLEVCNLPELSVTLPIFDVDDEARTRKGCRENQWTSQDQNRCWITPYPDLWPTASTTDLNRDEQRLHQLLTSRRFEGEETGFGKRHKCNGCNDLPFFRHLAIMSCTTSLCPFLGTPPHIVFMASSSKFHRLVGLVQFHTRAKTDGERNFHFERQKIPEGW